MDKTYDAAYFQRWYRRADIGGSARLARKVTLAVASAEYYLERPIRSVLDIGCGEGAWRAPLLKLRPRSNTSASTAASTLCAATAGPATCTWPASAISPGCGPVPRSTCWSART
ncbi:hypothetical protein BN1263180041 [Stenotrophomonas maltophilia]|nr:hypothetical protein BN1263180041 [Stenotrophomonas maltophilia]